jgi:BASS family bile acid:Na+ symporter
MLKTLLPLAFSGSLAALVLAVGLDATLGDLLYLVRRPKRLIMAFIAISVIVPIAAVLVTALFPLRPISQAGIILMAVAPVPPLVPGKGLKAGASKAYTYGLYVTFALLAVIIVPITIAVMSRIYGTAVQVAPMTIARVVLATVLAPLAVGLVLRALFPKLAERAAPIISKLSLVLLVVACVPVVIVAWPAMGKAIGDGTIISIVIIVAAALAGGHLLGGPDREDRAALALAAATRHPGIAMLIANASFQDKSVAAVVLLFLLVSIVVAIPYQIWLRRSSRGVATRSALKT